jgi:hypothetical protein
MISFGTESAFTHVEAEVFKMTSLSSAVVPENALLIADKTFPVNYIVARRGSDADFSEDRRVILPGRSEDL